MISRRDFAKMTAASLAVNCVSQVFDACGKEQPRDQMDDLPRPTPAQIAWQDCEIGLLFCFDLPIAAEIYTQNNTYRQRVDPAKYNPVKLDNESGHAGVPCYATMPGLAAGDLSHNSTAWKRFRGKGDLSGSYWSPAIVDIPLRGYRGHTWFYKPDQDHIVYPPDVLMQKYYTSVGRNANLIIGVVIKPHGTIPEADAKALIEFGKKLRTRFSTPADSTTDVEGDLITLELPKPQAIDHVILQEQIAHGERVRDHVVEGMLEGQWVELSAGNVIGHKWIYRFEPQTVSRLRLRITKSLAPPKIRSFSCFMIGKQ